MGPVQVVVKVHVQHGSSASGSKGTCQIIMGPVQVVVQVHVQYGSSASGQQPTVCIRFHYSVITAAGGTCLLL